MIYHDILYCNSAKRLFNLRVRVQSPECFGGGAERGEWESGERVQLPDSLVYEAVCESGGAGMEALIPSP